MDKAAFASHNITLPSLLKFGTSSWTYPGWRSLIYTDQYSSETAFKRECLREYVRNPLFQTVGLDSSFYAPPAASTLHRYKKQVPENFQFLVKAWEEITIPRFPHHKRYGARSGELNKEFLSIAKLETFLNAFAAADFERHVGVIVFQFQKLSDKDEPQWFLDRLAQFLELLPPHLRFAVEIRTPELLSTRYFEILNANRVTHCFSHWTDMPDLAQQMRAAADAGGLTAPFFAARILTPLRVSYAEAVRRHAPYTEIRTPLPQMRADLVRLAKRALDKQVPAFIVVNNRAEGCSPLTIDAIRLAAATQLTGNLQK